MPRDSDRQLNKSQDRPQTTPKSEAPAAGEELPPALLDQIVSETKKRLTAEQQIDATLRSALSQVARQYANQPLRLQPVGVALLEAMLAPSFPVLAERPALLARTAQVVAQTLLNDPAARLRLEHLWATLLEEQP
jgi:hypothetical protein